MLGPCHESSLLQPAVDPRLGRDRARRPAPPREELRDPRCTTHLTHGFLSALPQGLLAFRHELLAGQVDVQPDPSDLECAPCVLCVPSAALAESTEPHFSDWCML